MSAAEILTGTIRPVLGLLWTDHRIPNGPAAEAMMLAIGLQESRFAHRDQVVPGKPAGQIGPATGYWQFERGGGVAGVMGHARTSAIARALVEASGIAWDRDAVWRAFTAPAGDQIAAAFARLLLFTDPAPLPAPAAESEDQAWDYYLRNWRPGRPHRDTWGGYWQQAVGLARDAPASPPAVATSAASLAMLEARILRLERQMAAIAGAAG